MVPSQHQRKCAPSKPMFMLPGPCVLKGKMSIECHREHLANERVSSDLNGKYIRVCSIIKSLLRHFYLKIKIEEEENRKLLK